jgi:hypothetical protein
MTTNMRVIIAAIGVAVLTSPVMAQQSEPRPRGAAASIAGAHGFVTGASVHHVHAHQAMGRELGQKSLEDYLLDDCKHDMYLSCN